MRRPLFIALVALVLALAPGAAFGANPKIRVTVGGDNVLVYKYKIDSGEWSAVEIDIGTPIALSLS